MDWGEGDDSDRNALHQRKLSTRYSDCLSHDIHDPLLCGDGEGLCCWADLAEPFAEQQRTAVTTGRATAGIALLHTATSD